MQHKKNKYMQGTKDKNKQGYTPHTILPSYLEAKCILVYHGVFLYNVGVSLLDVAMFLHMYTCVAYQLLLIYLVGVVDSSLCNRAQALLARIHPVESESDVRREFVGHADEDRSVRRGAIGADTIGYPVSYFVFFHRVRVKYR